MKLEFSIGGYFSGESSLKLTNGKLEYGCSDAPGCEVRNQRIFQPTKEQWKEFIAGISKYQHWNKMYYDSDVHDGIQWELILKYGKIKIKSSGSNDYPDNFESFIKAIQKLTGDRECFE